MKIYVVTPIYPADTNSTAFTPLVHYFTREWVKQGNEVTVFHLCADYPSLFYLFARKFNRVLDAKLGIVPTLAPRSYAEVNESVNVVHVPLPKFKPHGRFSKKALKKAIETISKYVDNNRPDCLVGHWSNPTLEVEYLLKQKYGIPTCLVFHERSTTILNYYQADAMEMIDSLDLIGFRSRSLKQNFEAAFGSSKSSFMAYSGVPDNYVTSMDSSIRMYKDVKKYIFVGSLIERKCPAEILYALTNNYPDKDFTMTYVGEGREDQKIKKLATELGVSGSVYLLGRVPREDIVQHLKNSDVFIMMSKREVFGLVYLEAMSVGCIPVASRNEGFDGIIVDGYNGFLCDAGDVNSLSLTLARIKQMSSDRLKEISSNAIQTAISMTDSSVAKDYADHLNLIIKKK